MDKLDLEGNEPVKLTVLYGHIKIVETRRWVGGRLFLGGYAIHYDEHGKETHRTPDTVNVICDFTGCEFPYGAIPV